MSARYLLDTNICIYIAKHNPLAGVAKLEQLIPVYSLPEAAGEHYGRIRATLNSIGPHRQQRLVARRAILANFCQGIYDKPMSTMNISLPDALKAFVDDQVSQRGYGTSSEYVRELIRKDQDRLQLRGLLLAGAASAPAAPADVAYFAALRARVTQQAGR
jgi:antitoxin ParD1/3/4